MGFPLSMAPRFRGLVKNRLPDFREQERGNNAREAALQAAGRALAAQGSRGDTILAHIDSTEVALLRALGGAGTRNRRTGLLQFYEKPGSEDSVMTEQQPGNIATTDAGASDVSPTMGGEAPNLVAPSAAQEHQQALTILSMIGAGRSTGTPDTAVDATQELPMALAMGPSTLRSAPSMPNAASPPSSDAVQPDSHSVDVMLPGGFPVGGYKTPILQSPTNDFLPLIDAARQTRKTYDEMLSDPDTVAAAVPYLLGSLFRNVATGGRFDWQRQGNQIQGDLRLTQFKQLPQYRAVSNFNVGLFAQQAGLTLDQALSATRTYATLFSTHVADPTQPDGIAEENSRMIRSGYAAGELGCLIRSQEVSKLSSWCGVFEHAPRVVP